MSLETKRLKKELYKLESYLENKNLSFLEVVDWTSACVALFSEIGVSDIIIGKFLDIYSDKSYKTDNPALKDSYYGPFEFNKIIDTFNPKGKNYTFKPMFNSLYVYAPFVAAKKILEKRESEERIISKTLIETFNINRTQNIKNGLEKIQESYEKKDARGMVSDLITVTDNILNLIPELSPKDKIGKRLNKMYENKGLSEKYSVNKEVVWALNNARIIRNEQIQHLKNEHDGRVTLFEAVGYTHLLVLFINSLLASGEVSFDKQGA